MNRAPKLVALVSTSVAVGFLAGRHTAPAAPAEPVRGFVVRVPEPAEPAGFREVKLDVYRTITPDGLTGTIEPPPKDGPRPWFVTVAGPRPATYSCVPRRD